MDEVLLDFAGLFIRANVQASRTLYVGGLESRISDETLRRRFGKYGTILDVDVKNYESPSPFAFIQFADIESAVRAINTHSSVILPASKKGKVRLDKTFRE